MVHRVSFVGLLFFCCTAFLYAQWTGTGPVYTTDNVGIGTSNPGSYKLLVRGGHSGFVESSGINGITIRSNYDGFNQIYSDYWSGSSSLPLAIGHYASPYAMVLLQNGNVGIGTTNPGNYKLAVEGKLGARQIVVTGSSWADHVFTSDYRLKPLSEVETFIKQNRHLEGIPKAEEVEKEGANVGEIQVKLLEKIEELTLYMIDMKKENEELRARVAGLEGSGK